MADRLAVGEEGGVGGAAARRMYSTSSPDGSSSGGPTPLRPVKLFDHIPVKEVWPIYKEAELGVSDKSGWRAFANDEHANVFRFCKQWGEDKQARCDQVAKRWNIRNAPAKMNF